MRILDSDADANFAYTVPYPLPLLVGFEFGQQF